MNVMAAIVRFVPLILGAISAVERLVTAEKGKAKQDAAVAMIGDLVPLLESGIDREIVNEGDVQAAIRKVIDAIVALQNVVRDVTAKRVG